MATVSTRPTNGVSFGYVHTVTDQDATDDAVIIDFQVDYMLAASVLMLDGSDIDIANDIVVTYPANGQVSIADGSTLKITAGQQISIVAARRSS